MRLSWILFLVLRQCDGSPVTASDAKSTSAPGPLVITTTSGGSIWSQTFLPTRLAEYVSITTPTTITTADNAGKAALVGIFVGGLAWVGVAGPIPIAPPPTPPPEVPGPDKKPPEKDRKPPEMTMTRPSTSMNTLPAQTPFYHISRHWDAADKIHGRFLRIPYEKKNCAERSGPTVELNAATDSIKKFCKKYRDKRVDDKGFRESPDMGAGIVFSLSSRLNHICPEKFSNTLRVSDCEWLLKACLEMCVKKASKRHGGIIKDGCFVWSAVAKEYEGDLQCQKETGVDKDIGVEEEKVIESAKDFCAKHAAKRVKPEKGFNEVYFYDTRNSAAELSISYNNSAECSPSKVPEYDLDQAACERFFTRAIKGCDTNTRVAKYGGDVGDHCGVFRIKTRNVERFKCINNPRPDPTSMPSELALAAIKDYCGRKLELDPDYKYDNEFHQTTPKGSGEGAFVQGDTVVRMKAQFLGSAGDRDCPKQKKFTMKPDECERKLRVIIDGCQEKGGALIDKTSHGCVCIPTAMPNLNDRPQQWTRTVPDNDGAETVFVLSTDRSLLSIPALIKAFNEDYVYWARAVPMESMQQMVNNSLCFGLYKSITTDGGSSKLEQIGFTRFITDYVTFVYLCDVYILPEYQGAGLGSWMLGVMQAEMDKMEHLRRLMLMTRGDRTKAYYERLLGVKVMGMAGQAYVLGKIGMASCV
ncbi:hypothetical protein LOZ36_003502 [Ophidiomyces ophidiicola]|nr:hypothetical protein LOZ36_003502 [Ophidiomyces ophidiicola]